MKWVDYREKLGIGFNDEQKFVMLQNKITIFTSILNDYTSNEYQKYACMVGEKIVGCNALDGLQKSFSYAKNAKELISKYVAFHNTYSNNLVYSQKPITKIVVLEQIKTFLKNLNIPFEIVQDKDGIFIFPKGAQELDRALISDTLQWLNNYPATQKAFTKALRGYSESKIDNASEVADNFRKALETFFQEFFKGNKTLENYKSEYGTYLKSKGIPAEISNNFETLLDSYTKFNNNYAKHHDKTTLNVLEYIMYQTGNIIRLLITLNSSSK